MVDIFMLYEGFREELAGRFCNVFMSRIALPRERSKADPYTSQLKGGHCRSLPITPPHWIFMPSVGVFYGQR